MNFIQCFVIIFVFLSTPLVLGAESYTRASRVTECEVLGHVKCTHCKASTLIHCGYGKGTIMGYVNGNTAYYVLNNPYLPDKEFIQWDYKTVDQLKDGQHLFLLNSVPLYNSPLGDKMIGQAGGPISSKEYTNQQCRYSSEPFKRRRIIRGADLLVCYGEVVCSVNAKDKGETNIVQVGCVADPRGRCPSAKECMMDGTVTTFKFEVDKMFRELREEFQDDLQTTFQIMDEEYQERLDSMREEYEYLAKEREAVRDWIKREEQYKAVKAFQEENTRKRQRARHGGR